MSITLKDVAAAACVSSATVSKVLNSKYDVAPETVKIVEKAISQLGYQRGATRRGRPSASRPFHRQGNASVALLVTSPGSEVYLITASLIDGIEAVARERGFHFLMARLGEDGSLPLCLDPVQVEGLIVRSPSKGMDMALPRVPTVWVFKPGFGPAPGDLVLPDNEMVGQMAARYLLERGHRHLAVVNPHPEHPEFQTRVDRFMRFARKAGATTLAIEGDSLKMNEIADDLLSHTPSITGLFSPAGSNFVEDFYRALQSRRVRCCRDVDLISCSNDVARLRALDPCLPNIDIQTREIGRVAAETLLWRIQHPHEHRRCVLVEPRLVEGAPL